MPSGRSRIDQGPRNDDSPLVVVFYSCLDSDGVMVDVHTTNINNGSGIVEITLKHAIVCEIIQGNDRCITRYESCLHGGVTVFECNSRNGRIRVCDYCRT